MSDELTDAQILEIVFEQMSVEGQQRLLKELQGEWGA